MDGILPSLTRNGKRRLLVTPEGRRIRLHFLPPYCPDHNKIERTWQDLHANVTRNHRCSTMTELMRDVRNYLRKHNRKVKKQLRHALKNDTTAVPQLCTAI